MSISPDRIRADIEAIARCTATPGAGADRPTFSPQWRQAVDYVVGQARAAGCKVRTDAAGNWHVRPEALPWDAPAWLSGSHLDSVPHGGDFDGVAGVVIPLEILRATAAVTVPLELIIFAEEEGTTFGLGMLGSRAWTGDLSAKELARVRNAAGESYLEAGAAHGVRESLLLEDRLDPRRYLGLIEAHIEQGPGMWNAGVGVAVVGAIAGRRQYRCNITGVANHAGSTSMRDRRDALVGAATCILQFEGLANGIAGAAVITVGRIHARPNAINVIPAEAEFTIDFRAPLNDVLAEGDEKIRHLIRQTCERRGLQHSIDMSESAPAVGMDPRLCARLNRAAERLGVAAPQAVSGALHDAAVIAPHLPTAMLFIASRDGISHNPREFSRIEDITLAARIVQAAIAEDAR
ncbi:MAG TPA: Zn-dependent hydrolase [Tepidisphaeraceae bacterium]|nr:Zn-dependent hydrolase [Tepidisphaeraceae bacterium]